MYRYNTDPASFAKSEKKRKLSVAGNSAGGMMLIAELLAWILNFILSLALTVTGNTQLLSRQPETALIFQIVFSATVFIIPPIFFLLFTNENIRDIFPTGKVKFEDFTPLFLTGCGVAALANVGNNLFASVLSSLGMPPEGSELPNPTGFFGVALTLLSGAVLPALVEEFAMRGVLIGVLRKRVGDGAAVFISALLFGLMHGNLVQIPFAFLLGLFLGYITVRTNSIFPAVALHFFNNFCSIILDYISNAVGPANSEAIVLLYFILMLALGLFGTVLLGVKHKDGEPAAALTLDGAGTVCGSPLMIVYFVVMGIQIVLTQIGF